MSLWGGGSWPFLSVTSRRLGSRLGSRLKSRLDMDLADLRAKPVVDRTRKRSDKKNKSIVDFEVDFRSRLKQQKIKNK